MFSKFDATFLARLNHEIYERFPMIHVIRITYQVSLISKSVVLKLQDSSESARGFNNTRMREPSPPEVLIQEVWRGPEH